MSKKGSKLQYGESRTLFSGLPSMKNLAPLPIYSITFNDITIHAIAPDQNLESILDFPSLTALSKVSPLCFTTKISSPLISIIDSTCQKHPTHVCFFPFSWNLSHPSYHYNGDPTASYPVYFRSCAPIINSLYENCLYMVTKEILLKCMRIKLHLYLKSTRIKWKCLSWLTKCYMFWSLSTLMTFLSKIETLDFFNPHLLCSYKILCWFLLVGFPWPP